MADSAAFDWVCREIDEATHLKSIEVRGTVRIALKAAGLNASKVSSAELGVVLAKVMPGELETRGVADAEKLCGEVARKLAGQALDSDSARSSPEAVFKRLGG